MSALQIFLPVIWTAVATGVGLLLYRTSQARVTLKGVRVAGSAAIALLAFYGMYRATPPTLLSPRLDSAALLKLDLDDSLDTLKQAKSDCGVAGGTNVCLRALDTLETHIKRADGGVAALIK